MTDTHIPSRVFPRAKPGSRTAKHGVPTPQTENPAYRLAFQDMDFLLREDLRPVRFQLELLKPELILDEAKIASTFVMYGRRASPSRTRRRRCSPRRPTTPAAKIAERLVAKSKYYDIARELAQDRQQAARATPRQAPVRRVLGRRAVDHGSGQSWRGGCRRRIDRAQHPVAARTGAQFLRHARG